MKSIRELSYLANRPQQQVTEDEVRAFVEALLNDDRVEEAEYAGANDWGQQIKVKMQGLNDTRTIGGIVAHINRLESAERKKREKEEKAAKKKAKSEAAAAKEPKISFVDYLRYFEGKTAQEAKAIDSGLGGEYYDKWREQAPSLALPAEVVEQRKGLEGTEAQIAWAADIRAEKLEGASAEDRDAVLKLIPGAKFWITMRSAASDEFVSLAKQRKDKTTS